MKLTDARASIRGDRITSETFASVFALLILAQLTTVTIVDQTFIDVYERKMVSVRHIKYQIEP